MAHTATMYQEGIKHLLEGDINLPGAVITIMLMSDGYVPDFATHEFVDEGGGAGDPKNEEINFGGGDTHNYFAGWGNTGRKTLANNALTIGGGVIKWDGDDLVWTALAAALEEIHGVIVCEKGSADDTDSIMLFYVDFDPVFDPNGSDFNVNWHSDGLMESKDGT